MILSHLPLTPILIAGATTAIGVFFHNRSATIANDRQLRDAELSLAQEIFNEISNAMDVLYYYLAHGAMHVAVRKAKDETMREKEDAKTWDGHERAVLNWMTHKTRYAAQVRRYFGDENHRCLTKIQDAFDKARSLVTATYYKRESSVVKGDKEDSGKYYGIVRPPEDDLLKLNEDMIRDIQHRNVGRLRTK